MIVIESATIPAALGPYSQAVRAGNVIYLSGQIPQANDENSPHENDFISQVTQVFENLKILAEASNCTLGDCVKLTVSLIDMKNLTEVNQVINQYFKEPYPALACVGVSSLPKNARIEVEAILVV